MAGQMPAGVQQQMEIKQVTMSIDLSPIFRQFLGWIPYCNR